MPVLRKSFFVVCLLLAMSASAQKTPHFPIEQFTLENGLRVVFSEDHSIPLVSMVLAYNVGSRNEVEGKTGFAHLFEHMMFQGSANVARNQYGKYAEGSGGTYNGATREESTCYEANVPTEKLPLVLWMEADRMRSLAVTAENFKNQKEVVKEEKRLRLDNQPYAVASARLQAIAYQNYANQHMPIGLMKDLDNATLEYVQTFFHTYYAPNNAVLVLAGDFQSKTARGLIENYFGSIPRRADPPKPDIAEPGTTRAKSESVIDPFATTPATLLAWPGPPAGDPDAPVLDLVYTLLFKQETQRCWADIGGGERWIYAFQGGLEDHPGPALFRVLTIHRSDIKSTTIRDEIFAQIRRLQNELPSKEEVDRVRTRFLADYYRREVEPLNTRAYNLAIGKLWMDAPDHFFTQMDRYLTITPEQIQAAAKKYLVPEKCTFLAVKTSKMKDEKEGTE